MQRVLQARRSSLLAVAGKQGSLCRAKKLDPEIEFFFSD
jgi:hypothetical protein